MLAKVRRDWTDGYLKHSLDNLVRIELGLEENPNAVSRPWDMIVQQPDREPRRLPPDQAMDAIFDELGQALLILGAPGAGKTTLLLELTRDLLDRAEQNVSYPIPVVFHLSSWAVRRRPLADWLVDELAERYYVPRKLAQTWIDMEQVLPLLDGLDEVALEQRAACVEAINTFRRQHWLVPLAVCCRAMDYQALPVRVELSGAVVIKPLSRVQVSTYLKQAGKPLAGLRTVLRDDETLWELLETPLMLSIVALAYWGRSAAEVWATGSLEQRRRHLFAAYTKAMFKRRTEITEYTPDQTIRWLAWLAQSLVCNNLSIFYVESMQPDWLPSRAQQRLVTTVPSMLSGLVSLGLMGIWQVIWLANWLGGLLGVVPIWLVGLSIGGLGFGGLILGLILGPGRITPSETLRWSLRLAWRKTRKTVRCMVILMLVFELVFLVLVGLLLFKGVVNGEYIREALIIACLMPIPVLFQPMGTLLYNGLTSSQIETRTTPNEGIRRSLRNALISFLAGGLIGGLSGGLGYGLNVEVDSGQNFSLSVSPGWVLWGGLSLGFGCVLRYGGFAYLKHYVLRFLLLRNDYAPWNYIRFLDYATERIFLRKVGGGYIFIHRLLMEYFATLQPTDQAGQTKTGQLLARQQAEEEKLQFAAERIFLRKVGGGYIFIHRLLMEYFATLQHQAEEYKPQNTEIAETSSKNNA